VPAEGEEARAVALLARCARGDAAAADAFVRLYQADVIRFLSRMFGAQDASLLDVTQQTFLAALAGASRFAGRSKVRTWLLGVAHNKARMELRSRARRQRAFELLARLHLVAPPEAPRQERLSQAQRLERAILSLDADHRAIFILCEVEEQTCRDAAAALDVPEGTARRWLAEAKQRLRPMLADLDPQGGAP
jgi:RNA polymerase sigma-70 factor (ECF subfamily)